MKKKYIQPNVSVSFVVVESLLVDGSDGINRDQGNDWGGGAKKHDFTDDSFDNMVGLRVNHPGKIDD